MPDPETPALPAPSAGTLCRYCQRPENEHDEPVFADGIRRCRTSVESFYRPSPAVGATRETATDQGKTENGQRQAPLLSQDASMADVESKRAKECLVAIESALRMAIQQGGQNVRVHVGDVLRVIEAFRGGEVDGGAPVTGPFYPRPPERAPALAVDPSRSIPDEDGAL